VTGDPTPDKVCFGAGILGGFVAVAVLFMWQMETKLVLAKEAVSINWHQSKCGMIS
jgi:hypothetical protein